jgi:hypothetical protein
MFNLHGWRYLYDCSYMARTGKLVVRSERQERGLATAELVMAWARDVATGEPRYILELGPERRGAKCACECVSCGLALTAVNAAKATFKMRPHFRHPDGAERSQCLVLAARTAILSHFRNDGWLDLPRRRKTSLAVGLSGQYYEAWVESPTERVHITSVNFRDRTMAILTLTDGRTLRVALTGTTGDESSVDDQGLPVPMILLDVNDAAVASMSPEEIRRRLRLLPGSVRWCGHWSDFDLQTQADQAAEQAVHFLDKIPDGLDMPEGLNPALKRETVLHYEVKNILAKALEVMAPAMEAIVEVRVPRGRILRESWAAAAQMLELTHVKLEHRFGRLVPDVVCEGWAEGGNWLNPLLIEVTVTNHIDEERLERIRGTNAAALEIDLSLAGGRVTREELRKLVVEEVATKQWLNFPELNFQRDRLQRKLEGEAEEEFSAIAEHANRHKERRSRILGTPLSEIASEYLAAVTALCHLDGKSADDGLEQYKQSEFAARELVADAADKLAVRGFPEAGDSNLVGGRGILARILSIRLDKGVGYGVDTGVQVLNAIRQSKGPNRSNNTLYFIAARIYKPRLSDEQKRWLHEWTDEVKDSIKAGEVTYLRDPAYDRLLSLLFPEMATPLLKEFGKRNLAAEGDVVRERGVDHEKLPQRRPAGFLTIQPKAQVAEGVLQDTGARDWWLKGRDLERWKLAHPDAAKSWFRSVK